MGKVAKWVEKVEKVVPGGTMDEEKETVVVEEEGVRGGEGR